MSAVPSLLLRSIGRRALSTSTARSASAKSGLSFELSDEEREIRDMAFKFAKEEIVPKAAHYDKTGEYPWDIFRKAHALGLVNTEIPVS